MIFGHFVCYFIIVSAFTEAVAHQSNSYNCPEISLRNGIVSRKNYLKFSCDQAYLLAGSKASICKEGKWEPTPPKCVRATCKYKPRSPANGNISTSHQGAAVHYSCLQGFSLRGPPDVFCDGDIWDNSPPICLATGEKPKFSCNFETENICGWTHDLNHDFDWKRTTTPRYLGTNGAYMHMESSGRKENDSARLISPVYDAVHAEVCFEFFYHMFGENIGSLRVYLKKKSDSWNLDPEKAISFISGDPGNAWYKRFIPIGKMDEDFQIVIEGVCGSSSGDIAIDDVKIILNCNDGPIVSTTPKSAVYGIYPIVHSCENRCGLTNGIYSYSYHLTCDCVDCYKNNRCCPDFDNYCVTATTTPEHDATTNLSSEIAIDRFSPSFFKSTFNKTEEIVSTTPKQPNFNTKTNETVPSKSSSTDNYTWTTQASPKATHFSISQANSSITSSTKAVEIQTTPTTIRTTKKSTSTLFIKTNPSNPKSIIFTIPDNKKTYSTIPPTTPPTTPKRIKVTTPKIKPKTPHYKKPTTPKRIKATTPKIKPKTPLYKKPQKSYSITTRTTPKIARKTTASTIKTVARSTKRIVSTNPKQPNFNTKTNETVPSKSSSTTIDTWTTQASSKATHFSISQVNSSITSSTKAVTIQTTPTTIRTTKKISPTVYTKVDDNDETLLITTAPDEKISDQYSSEEVEKKLEFVHRKNFSKPLKLFTEKVADTDTNNVMAIVVSAIGTVVFIIIVAILIMKYYKSPLQRTLFSSSISQTHVRFFPEDESLEFSLDNDLYGKIN